MLVLIAVAACDEPAPSTPADAPAADAPDAAPSPFGRCGAGVTRARMAYGRLLDAAPEGALIASPAVAFWPADGGAPIALPDVPEPAVTSGAYLYWRQGDAVIERALAGGQRTVAIAAPSAIVRAPAGGVYVVSGAAPSAIGRAADGDADVANGPATITLVSPGAGPMLVTTTTGAISNLAAGANVIAWQEAGAIRCRVISTGAEGTVLADATAHLLGVQGSEVVVERRPMGTSSVEIERYDVATGASTATRTWSDGPVLATALGPTELYLSVDRRETMVARQWCSIQPSLYALAWSGMPEPVVTEPERAIATTGIVYVQTAAEHGQTCCSGHGMFSCNEPSVDPQAVWCFRR